MYCLIVRYLRNYGVRTNINMQKMPKSWCVQLEMSGGTRNRPAAFRRHGRFGSDPGDLTDRSIEAKLALFRLFDAAPFA